MEKSTAGRFREPCEMHGSRQSINLSGGQKTQDCLFLVHKILKLTRNKVTDFLHKLEDFKPGTSNRTLPIKEEYDTLNFIKIKNLLFIKDTLKRERRDKPQTGIGYLQNMQLTEGSHGKTTVSLQTKESCVEPGQKS